MAEVRWIIAKEVERTVLPVVSEIDALLARLTKAGLFEAGPALRRRRRRR